MEEKARELGMAFGEVDQIVRDRMRRTLAESGISSDEWAMLAWFYVCAHGGEVDMPHGKTTPSVRDPERVLGGLRERGYVRCQSKRPTTAAATLTREGQRLVEALMALNQGVMSGCVAYMSPSELDVAIRSLRRMRDTLI